MAKHRDDLIKDGIYNVASFGPEGMKLWQAIMDRALADWSGDMARAIQETRDRFVAQFGSLRDEDLKQLSSAKASKRPYHAGSASVVVSDPTPAQEGYKATLQAWLVAYGSPGAEIRWTAHTRIRETGESHEHRFERYLSAGAVNPEDLAQFWDLLPSSSWSFPKAGKYTVEIRVVDGTGATVWSGEETIAIGTSGKIGEVHVQARYRDESEKRTSFQSGRAITVIVDAPVEGFEAFPEAGAEVRLMRDGRRVPGVRGSATGKREDAILVPLELPDALEPGTYLLEAELRIGESVAQGNVRIEILQAKACYGGFSCIVSTEVGGGAAGVLHRGDYVYFRVEFDGKFVPAGAVAQVKWTVHRPVKSAITTRPVEFSLHDGRNSFRRPEPAKITEESDAGSYGVTAIVTIDEESFEASTAFRVREQSVEISLLVFSPELGGTAKLTFVPGEAVWMQAYYTLEGAEGVEQVVQVIWSASRDGGDLKEIGRGTVHLAPGRHRAVHGMEIPKKKGLGEYSVQVSIRAGRQEAVERRAGFQVKPPIEWEEPPLVAGDGKDSTEAIADFQSGDTVFLVLRYRVNVEREAKVRWQISTVGPDGAVGELSGKHELPAKEESRRGWVNGTIADTMRSGNYKVTGRVWWGDGAIETRTSFTVFHPVRITNFSVVERTNSPNGRTRFRQGSNFGVYVGYRFENVPEGARDTVSVAAYYQGKNPSIWSKRWGPFDAKEGNWKVTGGARWRRDQMPGKYLFVAEVKIGESVARAEVWVTVEKEPDLEPPPEERTTERREETTPERRPETSWDLAEVKGGLPGGGWTSASGTVESNGGRYSWSVGSSGSPPASLSPGQTFSLTATATFQEAVQGHNNNVGASARYASDFCPFKIDGREPQYMEAAWAGRSTDRNLLVNAQSKTWTFTVPASGTAKEFHVSFVAGGGAVNYVYRLRER